MRSLGKADTLSALPMVEAIDAMREAFLALYQGKAVVPARTHLQLGGVTSLTMPGIVRDPARVGAKLITVVPENTARGQPVIQGIIVLFDPITGAVRGFVDGEVLTALRTGAASGLATRLLAREDAESLAMIGSGPQADTQVEAVCCVRPIARVVIYSRTAAHARALAMRLEANPNVPDRIRFTVAASVDGAVRDADVVCTATRATEPQVLSEHVRAGTHINAVGSYTLAMQELDIPLLGRARVFVDDVEASLSEAGELAHALEAGVLKVSDLTTLGQLVARSVPGRTGRTEVTVFKSVGLAIQDLCAAGRAMDRAEANGLGKVIGE